MVQAKAKPLRVDDQGLSAKGSGSEGFYTTTEPYEAKTLSCKPQNPGDCGVRSFNCASMVVEASKSDPKLPTRREKPKTFHNFTPPELSTATLWRALWHSSLAQPPDAVYRDTVQGMSEAPH